MRVTKIFLRGSKVVITMRAAIAVAFIVGVGAVLVGYDKVSLICLLFLALCAALAVLDTRARVRNIITTRQLNDSTTRMLAQLVTKSYLDASLSQDAFSAQPFEEFSERLTARFATKSYIETMLREMEAESASTSVTLARLEEALAHNRDGTVAAIADLLASQTGFSPSVHHPATSDTAIAP